jgi:flagella basal body P-ring formation protein FlgA
MIPVQCTWGKTMRAWLLVAFGLTSLVGTLSGQEKPQEDRMAIVQLEIEVTRPPGVLRIGDIARVWATDKRLEQQVTALEIGKLAADQEQSIAIDDVRIRLQVHGLTPDVVRVVGPDLVTAKLAVPGENDTLAIFIRDALAERWGALPEDVIVEIHQPTADATPALRADETWKIDIPQSAKPGRLALRALRMKGSIVMRNLPVQATVSVYGDVAVAAATIPQRRTLQASDVRVERRALTSLDDRWIAGDWVGKSTRQTLQAGQVVRTQYLSDAAVPSEEIAVKARSVVRLTVRKGNLSVTASGGESLQSGRIGDWVRVRNPQSGKIVSGRVTGPDEVEVPF